MNTDRMGRALSTLVRGGLAATMGLALTACDMGNHSGTGGSSSAGPTGSSSGASGVGGGTGAGGSSSAAFGSVCGFTAPVTLGAAAADGYVTVPANHPDILYFGRVDCSTPTAPAFAWPGVSIRMQFEGTGVDLMLTDSGNAAEVNYYDVIIDGGTPTDLQMMPGAQTYQLARNLASGTHTVEVFKRIESAPGGAADVGKGVFNGFRIPQTGSVLPLAPKPHRIEIIGDSISCGYGDEVSTTDPATAHYTTAASNAYDAYGAVAARALDAEYMAVAYSGRGMYRNNSTAPQTIPDLYTLTLPDEASGPMWNTKAWTPDVVVVNLGTNDFYAAPTDDALYQSTYVTFLQTLRGDYPEALIIVTTSPMLSNYYPTDPTTMTVQQSWSDEDTDLMAVVANRKAAGDTNIALLTIQPQSPPYGEDYHPTVATHQAMANQLVTLVKSLENW